MSLSIGSTPSLREYLHILRSRKWYVAFVAAIAVAAGLFYSFRQTPMYTSGAQVLVRPVNLSSTDPSGGAAVNMQTEIRVATSAPVAALAVQELERSPVGLSRLSVESPADNTKLIIHGTSPALERLNKPGPDLGKISVSSPSDTEILVIDVLSPDPAAAQSIAQAMADSYLGFRGSKVLQQLQAAAQPIKHQLASLNQELVQTQKALNEARRDAATALSLRLSAVLGQITSLNERLNGLVLPEDVRVGDILQPAERPRAPVSPKHVRTGAFAVFVGLVLGIGAAFIRDRLDERIRSREDLEEGSGAPVLAVVPPSRGRSRWRRKRKGLSIEAVAAPGSEMADAFRTLSASLLAAAADRHVKTVLVTSPGAGEGKTTTTVNLGVLLAHAGKRVVIVSADLRKPTLDGYFTEADGSGLTGVLSRGGTLADALVPAEIDNLQLLPAGPLPVTPDSLMGSDEMKRLISELRRNADFVLIDSAPLVVSDTIALVRHADAVLLVVDAERTVRGAIVEARYQLDRVGGQVIGAVLNNYRRSGHAYYGGYKGYDRYRQSFTR